MRGRHRWHLLFLAAVWLVGTLFLRADLGQWNDDYAYDRRDVVTGLPTLPFDALMPRFFYRPLYYLLVPNLETRLGGHPAVLHLISAAVHALVGGLLFALLRRIGPTPAALAAALFLVDPAHWEVPFWPAAIPTALSAAGFLTLALLFLRFVQRPLSWPGLAAIALVAFAIPCLNEQPAAGIPALLLLTPLAREGAAPRFRQRALGATAVALAAVALYLALYWLTIPADHRGSPSSFTHAADLPDKWRRTLAQIRLFFFVRQDFGAGALVQGAREIAAAPAWAVAGGLCLAGAFVALLMHATNAGETNPAPRLRAPAQLVLFGLAVFALTWVPVLLLKVQGVEPRLCYAPALGLACALGGLLHIPFRPRVPRPLRLAAFTAVAAPILAGIVAMIGVQGALRARWLHDLDEAAQLRALIPGPAPGSIFVPLLARSRATSTGRDRFDDYFAAPMERPWSAPFYIRRAYARADLDAAWRDRLWGRPLVIGAEPRGLRYDDVAIHRFDQLRGPFELDAAGAKLLPFDRIVPLLIDHDGRVRLIAAFIVPDAAGNGTEYPIPQVRALQLPAGSAISVRFRQGVRGAFEVMAAP